jgi:hypothetical protein
LTVRRDFEVISRPMWEFLKTHNISPNCTEIKRFHEKPTKGGFNCDIDLYYKIVRKIDLTLLV